jgi:uncharacterized Tic20 family protein
MFCADTKNQWLYLWLADGSDPNNHQIEASTRSALFGLSPWENRDGVRFVHLRGFVFRHAATFPQRAAVWLHGSDNLLEDCIVEEMAGGGVLVHGTMRRCIIRRCGHTGGGAAGTNFLNEDCVWEGNSWKPIDRGWDAGGFKLAWAKDGVFRRCVFRRNGGPGLWLDIHVRHVIITDCTFWENEHHGLFVEISRDITIVRNLFVRNGIGVVGKVEWPDWGIAGLTIAESQNCVVAFNTFVGNKDGIALREQGPRPLETDDYGVIPYHNRGHVIVGNICAFNRGYQLALWYDNGFFGWHPAEREKFKTEAAYEAWLKANPDRVFDPTKVGMVIDRNLYWAERGQKLILYGVPWRPKYREFNDLSEWRKATGFDQTKPHRRPKVCQPSSRRLSLAPRQPRPPIKRRQGARHGSKLIASGWMLLSKGEEAMGQPNVTDEERLWAMLAHLLALLGYVVWLGAYIAPLVIYLVYKDKSQFVAFHALQSLFFQLALLVVAAICALLAITIVLACIAIPLALVVSVGALAYIIVAAVRAYNGELFEYWLVGKWARQIVGI